MRPALILLIFPGSLLVSGPVDTPDLKHHRRSARHSLNRRRRSLGLRHERHSAAHRRRWIRVAIVHRPARRRKARLPRHSSLRRQHRHCHVQRQRRSLRASTKPPTAAIRASSSSPIPTKMASGMRCFSIDPRQGDGYLLGDPCEWNVFAIWMTDDQGAGHGRADWQRADWKRNRLWKGPWVRPFSLATKAHLL